MITKIKANKSFRGTTKYVLEKEQAQIIGGNMYGSTIDKLVEQFTLSAHLNPQLKDPCYHLMLSVPKTDRTLNDDELANLSQRHFANVIVLSRLKGEEAQVKQPDKRISDTKLNQLVDEFIETELPAYDFFIARHSDKKHDHTHIIASRVNNLDGKSIRTWNNYAYSEHSARLLEREYNLTPVQSSWESKRKAMTRNQLERVERDGLPGEEIMRRAIEQVAVNKPTMPEFIQRLWSEHQVKAVVSYYSHGGVRGIKFGIDIGSVNDDGSPRLLWKQGGNLNKYKCSFTKLQSELGVSYKPERDNAEIKRLNTWLESAPITKNNQLVIEQSLSPKAIDNPKVNAKESSAIAETKTPITPDQSLELYRYYSVKLENELVTDRDKKVAVSALQDGKTAPEVEEILKASPAFWSQEEARALVLIAESQFIKQQRELEAQRPQQQQLRKELLAIAVPVGVELINHLLKGTDKDSLRFKHSTLSKQGRELVFTHDERGEVFRVNVNRNHQGELEYSLVNIGELRQSDIETWQKAKQVLLEYIEQERQQQRTQNRGLSR
ncbi:MULTISPECIES: relaxase/mobilization nuclease domain-containing protein [unclassified Tolypothrix]|uniref:relaxase/mobilization nuclease domain-containing protein n=1 Tax=unclassified Tolypothrix TaxID=2649714 RepID=UPI0005EAB3E6|nr:MULTISPECIES: relaxase/mobilization nuclease domain-containing protein [unclassified Tolypothrix]BAY95992.1 relaxase/mobilization nuclease family protein [Microchaete diplosiphon NIES-3275]EKE96765.1 putative relaxase [Tolypothrix sp. PCC 7601]MBE9084919.1 relaxase/mobilization nuclease domain-containing protein [Tolypothrix sp. LEGE 11397]UYD31155.1 relaxase/mobilization nuclease domain-containing protein [Tolypothrix sp. PCC 7712]UYD38951.1 relaxase/mobilization nuclease domain-containing